MKIVADENIPYAADAFRGLGDVSTLPGRGIDAEAVKDAELLLVRSVTKVNATLLDGSAVRFVGTATIGEDHIDKGYLKSRGIGSASAPGSNANSVAEYVTAALLELAVERDFDPSDRVLGIVGHGNVGSRVEVKARALGMDCVLNDPPLARETGDAKYRPLDELLAQCNIITIHVPLTRDGDDAPYHLLDDAFLERVRTGTIVINTARGEVVDGKALRNALEAGQAGACVLDVWEQEPTIDLDLMANCAIATAHIAGYSFDGKVNGTRQVYEAACAFLGEEPSWNAECVLPPPHVPEVQVNGARANHLDELRKAVATVYDIRRDDRALRRMVHEAPEKRGAFFDRLRNEYPMRREFINTRALVEPPNATMKKTLSGMGFRVEA